MKRDSRVELLRLVGCLIVIGVHTCLNVVVNGNYDFSRTYISCLLADGVAVFFLITGFFLFSNHDYVRLLKKTAKNFVIPMMIVSIVMFYFGGWLIEGTTLSESVLHSSEEYRKVIKTLLTWRNPVNGMGHLWYLYIYVILMITFPVLKSFVEYLEQNNGVWWFVLISFVLMVLNDIVDNKLLGFSHYSINGWFPAAIEVMWGHILYQHKEDILKICKSPLLWAGCFAAMNLVRGVLIFDQYQMGGEAIIFYIGTHRLVYYVLFA